MGSFMWMKRAWVLTLEETKTGARPWMTVVKVIPSAMTSSTVSVCFSLNPTEAWREGGREVTRLAGVSRGTAGEGISLLRVFLWVGNPWDHGH
jgi:hypothetical protein